MTRSNGTQAPLAPFDADAEGKDTPLYLRLRDRLRRQIADGVLPAGKRLPSSRQLAHDLGVSRITVTSAYAELEADGLVVSRTGSGTYVAPEPDVPATGLRRQVQVEAVALPEWQRRLAAAGAGGVGTVNPVREALIRRAQWLPPLRSGTISFAQARGDQRLFPHRELRAIMADLFREGTGALGYEPPEGSAQLRRLLSQYLRQHGVAATPDEILITAGAQQAFSLISTALLRPGDVAIVEEPTFTGALETLESRRARIVGVPMDAEGIDPRALEAALRDHPARVVYLVPTFHNPTTTVTSAARRREIASLAARYGVPVVEDEYLREVRFGSPIPPPIAAFDRHGHVIHVGSFSKSLSPAFRLGYVVARGPLREQLLSLKRVTDICCSAVLQRAAASFLESGAIYAHWKRVSRAYRKRQAAMVAAVQRHFPAGCSWSNPPGGVLLWIRLPEGASGTALMDDCLREGVSFTPGAVFFTEPADQPYVRLNYAALDEREIERGVEVIGRQLRKQVASLPAPRSSSRSMRSLRAG